MEFLVNNNVNGKSYENLLSTPTVKNAQRRVYFKALDEENDVRLRTNLKTDRTSKITDCLSWTAEKERFNSQAFPFSKLQVKFKTDLSLYTHHVHVLSRSPSL